MLFDETIFNATMKRLTSDGDRAGLEAYLASEFQRLGDSEITIGGSCCCGKSACRLEEEDLAWQRNRLQGQVMIGSELADLYRENKAWDRCFETYEILDTLLREAGLAETEAYGRILINRAYAHMDREEDVQALEDATAAEMLLEKADSGDCNAWTRLYNLISVVCRRKGDAENAAWAMGKAVEKIRSGSKDPDMRAQMLLNHAATLQHMGNPEDALQIVDSLIAEYEDSGEMGMPYFAALNLKATICYQLKAFLSAGETFAALIDAAGKAGVLTEQLGMVCRNCSKMFSLAGDAERAQKYEKMADTF